MARRLSAAQLFESFLSAGEALHFLPSELSTFRSGEASQRSSPSSVTYDSDKAAPGFIARRFRAVLRELHLDLEIH